MFVVYMLRSEQFPQKTYTGFTRNLQGRVQAHNNGQSPHTAKFKPWKLVCAVAFEDERRAREFEHYLKTGSGRAFANRHFW